MHIFYFSLCQKTNLHLYKRARLLSSLFTYHNKVKCSKLNTMLILGTVISRNVVIACSIFGRLYNNIMYFLWKKIIVCFLGLRFQNILPQKSNPNGNYNFHLAPQKVCSIFKLKTSAVQSQLDRKNDLTSMNWDTTFPSMLTLLRSR